MVIILTVFSFSLPDASVAKLPDLYTIGFLNRFSPAQLYPGEMLSIRWLTANNATMCIPEFPCIEIFGPAYGPWQEAAFLSTDASPDGGDILLGTITFDGTLGPGGAHEVITQFQVPFDCLPGDYKVIVYVDYVAGQPNGQVTENGETNNWGACTGTLMVMPAPPQILLLYPNGGEFLIAGTTHTIRWLDYRGDANCLGDYLLDYSADNGQNWTAIDPNVVSNTCSCDWVVPAIDSNECLVRIIDANDSDFTDTSDAPFTIYRCTLKTKADLTGDCVVNFADLAILVEEWLKCGNPFDPTCVQ
jgi:hypothetical protein